MPPGDLTTAMELAKGFGAGLIPSAFLIFLWLRTDAKLEAERKDKDALMRESLVMQMGLKSLLERLVAKAGA